MPYGKLPIVFLSTLASEKKDSTNSQIATYLLNHLDGIKDIGIQEMAKECSVAMSSISRFCKEIGLNDFNELRELLITTNMTFEQVNDVYGHYCGDLYLKQMTNVLKTISGEKCLVGRLGGDEFIAFFHHYDSMEKLNNDINQLNEIRDQIVLLADDHSVN